MFNESGLQLSLNACVETIRLFKIELNKTFAEAPVRNRLCELIKLLAEVLSSAVAQTKFEYLYGQYESLNLILIFMDNFLLLSKQNGYLDSFRWNPEYFLCECHWVFGVRQVGWTPEGSYGKHGGTGAQSNHKQLFAVANWPVFPDQVHL